MTTVVIRGVQSAADPWEFVASSEAVDRYGDVVMASAWDLKNFKKNPIALWLHSGANPIGVWENVRVEGGKLLARLVMAKPGTSSVIDMLRGLIEQRILRSVSVGFLPKKWEDLDPENPRAGRRYTKAELLEISVVTIPANPEALAVAKSLGMTPELQSALFLPSESAGSIHKSINRPTAERSTPRNTTMKTLAQQIKALEEELVLHRDKVTELSAVDPTEETDTELAEATVQLNAVTDRLERLQAAQAAIARKAVAPRVEPNADPKAGDPPRVFARAKQKAPPADILMKAGFATFRSIVTRTPIEQVVKEVFGSETKELEVMIRAATAAANTTTPAWAGELIEEQTAEFATLLVPTSVFAAFPGFGVSFDTTGKIRIPGRNYAVGVSGGFVGEGGAIPVKAGALRSILMTPHKVAVIIALTRELAQRSSPAALPLFRQMVLEDTSITLDTLFLDNTAAVAGIRPAGMQTFATGANTRVSSGATLANIIADVKDMVGQMGTNRLGRRPVWIMNESNRLGLSMLTNDLGQFMFKDEIGRGTFFGYPIISSLNVPTGIVFLIDANEIVKAAEGAPNFDVSESATVHMDSAPNADIAVPATGIVSFWQTDQMGLRMIWDLTWAARQDGAVQTLTGVAW